VPSQSRDSSQVAQLSFDSVDTNKDGVITPNEALAVPGLDFSSADTDKSRTLDRQEFAAAMATTRPGG
jgi:Ca2+-binding EF-hand superfamily protein